MLKNFVFLFFVMFLALGSWAQSSSIGIQIPDSLTTNKFTITTWAGEDLDFMIFDGYFMLKNPDNSWKKLESFNPKEIAKPVMIAKPRYGKYENACDENRGYLICIYLAEDGSVWESFLDIDTKSITAVTCY